MDTVKEHFTKFDEMLCGFFKKKWAPFVIWPVAILLIYAVYFLFIYQQKMYGNIAFNSEVSRVIFVVFLVIYEVLIALYFGLSTTCGRLTTRKAVFLIFMFSAGLVLPFTMARTYNDSAYTHDYGVFGEGGHWAIIYDIYKTGKIPGVDLNNQYYQPKFYHASIAYFMRINSILLPHFDGSDSVIMTKNNLGEIVPLYAEFNLFDYTAFETARIFLTFQGIITLYFIYKTIVELGLNKRISIIGSLIVFFTPAFWFISAYKNNDSLALLFSFAALYAALRYHKTHSYAPLVATAICIGLGMEAKLSTAVVAFPIAAIFLLDHIALFRKDGKWVKADNKALIKFIIQMGVFAVIVFPLGLFFEIFAKMKYDRPIAYVWDLGTGNYMYIKPEYYPAWARLFIFPSPDLFFNITNVRSMWPNSTNPSDYVWGTIDFNCWTAFLKTGLFSESDIAWTVNSTGDFKSVFWILVSFAYALSIMIGIAFIIGGIYFVIKKIKSLAKGEKQKDDLTFYFLFVTFVSGAISYMLFCLRYPVGCTMNARYAMLLYLPIGLVVAALIDHLLKKVETKKKEASVATGFWAKK
ncbi:MAG: phospholipid carrier-dependent glycosyltransferase [Bacilli bacterium]|nr:phospholipid carrier-dependent glycosyltransferase [Bacilli bacterium]